MTAISIFHSHLQHEHSITVIDKSVRLKAKVLTFHETNKEIYKIETLFNHAKYLNDDLNKISDKLKFAFNNAKKVIILVNNLEHIDNLLDTVERKTVGFNINNFNKVHQLILALESKRMLSPDYLKCVNDFKAAHSHLLSIVDKAITEEDYFDIIIDELPPAVDIFNRLQDFSGNKFL